MEGIKLFSRVETPTGVIKYYELVYLSGQTPLEKHLAGMNGGTDTIGGVDYFEDLKGHEVFMPERPEWWAEAVCRGSGHDAFFIGRSPSERDKRRLKRICGRCAVQEECLEEGLLLDQLFGRSNDGVFGGRTATERQE